MPPSKTTEAPVFVPSPPSARTKSTGIVRVLVDKDNRPNPLVTRKKTMPLVVNLIVPEDTSFQAKQTITRFTQGQTVVATLESQLLAVQHEKKVREVATGLGKNFLITLLNRRRTFWNIYIDCIASLTHLLIS